MGWWRRSPLTTLLEVVTVEDLLRRRDRARSYAARPRRVLVLPRRHSPASTRSPQPVTVRYQGRTQCDG